MWDCFYKTSVISAAPLLAISATLLDISCELKKKLVFVGALGLGTSSNRLCTDVLFAWLPSCVRIAVKKEDRLNGFGCRIPTGHGSGQLLQKAHVLNREVKFQGRFTGSGDTVHMGQFYTSDTKYLFSIPANPRSHRTTTRHGLVDSFFYLF